MRFGLLCFTIDSIQNLRDLTLKVFFRINSVYTCVEWQIKIDRHVILYRTSKIKNILKSRLNGICIDPVDNSYMIWRNETYL